MRMHLHVYCISPKYRQDNTVDREFFVKEMRHEEGRGKQREENMAQLRERRGQRYLY